MVTTGEDDQAVSSHLLLRPMPQSYAARDEGRTPAPKDQIAEQDRGERPQRPVGGERRISSHRAFTTASISSAARTPLARAPFIVACQGSVCSPAKWTRPSGRARTGP